MKFFDFQALAHLYQGAPSAGQNARRLLSSVHWFKPEAPCDKGHIEI
jgi:hypothetical protein